MFTLVLSSRMQCMSKILWHHLSTGQTEKVRYGALYLIYCLSHLQLHNTWIYDGHKMFEKRNKRITRCRDGSKITFPRSFQNRLTNLHIPPKIESGEFKTIPIMQLETEKESKVYLWTIGKWMHKNINCAKIIFHRFSNFLQEKLAFSVRTN